MTRILRGSLAVLLLVGVAALPAAAQVDTGSADFSNYVAVGDSLTAAIVSGGWVGYNQANSFPALIHRQATGTDDGFEQPTISSPGIPAPLRVLSLSPVILAPASSSIGAPTNLMLPRPYNNLGIPGADVGDTVRTVTDGGGAHDLVLRGLGTALQQAVASHPTFVTLWIGNNDALGAATSGLAIDGVTLTTLSSFEADYRTVAGALASTGAKMAIATVPPVTTLPFVNTVPRVVVNPATSQPVLGPTGAPIPLIGPDGPLAAGDHVLLTATTYLAQGFGIPAALGGNGQPLPDTVVLNAAETAKISDRVNGYNSIIRTVAGEVGAALIESGPLLQEFVSGGVDIGGITYTSSFLTGGLFSYDGVHPSPFGYAYIANEYIKAINETYDASIPEVDLYPFIFGEFSLAPAAVTVAEARSAQLSPDAVSNLHWLLTSPDASAVKEPPRGRGKGGRGQGADDPATQDDEPSAIDQPDPTPRGRGGRSDF